MTDITIKDGRAQTVGKANLKWFSIRKQLEGQTRLIKDGSVTFVGSKHNIEIWKSVFPASNVFEEKTTEEAPAPNLDRPKFKLKREQLWWQEKATEKQLRLLEDEKAYNAFAFFFDPGAGKSKGLTDFATYLYCEGKIDALVILPPNVLVGEQWSNEEDGALVRDIHEDVPFKAWLWNRSLPKKHKEDYEDLLKFNGFQCIVANIDAIKTERGYEYIKRFIDRHRGRIMFAVDEAHLIAKTTSARHKKAVDLGHKCSWRAVLTGTPINKNLMSAFGIFKFLDPRILGFRYATAFRNAFCVTRWNGFADQIVGHKNIEKFYELIEPYSQRVSQEEMGLDKVRDEFVFNMSPEQRKHFDSFKAQWLADLDDGKFATASIALTAATRLQQITNGFLVDEEGATHYFENARLAALDAWLETIDEDQKIMIWCRFLEDAKILSNHFGKSAVDLSGNVDSKERVANKYRFLREPEIIRCIATPDAAGTGMDGLQDVCNRALFYSTSEHYINRKQAEDRTLRVGGGSVAFYTDLICRGSPDRKILRTLQNNQDFAKMTLDDVRKLFE